MDTPLCPGRRGGGIGVFPGVDRVFDLGGGKKEGRWNHRLNTHGFFQIDTEFEQLIPPLSEGEFNQLEALLLTEGCKDALVTWNGVLLDGHHRLKICTRHGLPYRTEEVKGVNSREAALDWMLQRQFGRRNLNPIQTSYLRGWHYNRVKQDRQANLKQNAPKPQNGVSECTAEKLAKVYGVSKNTLWRDGQFAEAVEAIAANVGEDFRRQVLSPES